MRAMSSMVKYSPNHKAAFLASDKDTKMEEKGGKGKKREEKGANGKG